MQYYYPAFFKLEKSSSGFFKNDQRSFSPLENIKTLDFLDFLRGMDIVASGSVAA